MGKETLRKEEVAEDFCFVCKEGGKLLICEYKNCLKVYHPQCVDKDESFLEGDESWTCDWHRCFICQKRSKLRCLCCPRACCTACAEVARFIRVRKSKGFCSCCLNILILAKENANHNSDGGNLDSIGPKDPHFLFIDYWRLIKEEEKITSKDLDEVETLFKQKQNHKQEGALEKYYSLSMVKQSGSLKRSRLKKRIFRGWGSIELIEFLTSLGKDISQPLDQWDVYKIIEGYIHENNLLLPEKKKKTIFCDNKLVTLLGKVEVKVSKVYNILGSHFAENAGQDDSFIGLEEESLELESKKKMKSSESVRVQIEGKYASMMRENLSLIYLRRSLIMELLKDPQEFEKKAIGCFVRIKNDRKDVDFSPDKVHSLRKVSGIKILSEAYTVGDMSINIVLCAFNCSKDIYISMLSDDDFQEEECEDLRELIRKGPFEKPTIVEFDEKLRSVHEDIMNHWIKRELILLQRKIERASEKGWFQEKIELIERRALLQSDSERERLTKEIPRIVADVE